jgi:hypothetical protein
MAWRMASSLNRLLTQINEFAPARSKRSDGGIADEHHPTSSDHSPRRFPWAAAPLVLARDITHDPAGGLACNRLRDALVRSRDPRIAYIIWWGQIISGAGGPKPWLHRPYTGQNRHDKHLHISVVRDALADSVAAWDLKWGPPAVRPHRPTIFRDNPAGNDVEAVKLVQRYVAAGPVDGVFGPATEEAVKRYQFMRRLEPDGAVGPLTWAEIDGGLLSPPPR